MSDYTNWDGTADLTTQTIVGAYGARARYVGPAADDGVVVVQFEETANIMLILKTALSVPASGDDAAIQAIANTITDTDSTITAEAALAAAKAIYASGTVK